MASNLVSEASSTAIYFTSMFFHGEPSQSFNRICYGGNTISTSLEAALRISFSTLSVFKTFAASVPISIFSH